nr:tetratricopeptide repeat protein [Mycolicibacterium poriferae]
MTAPERPAIRSLLQPVQLGTPFLPGGSLKLITASEKPSRRYLKAMRQIQEGPLSGSANEAAASLLELQQAVVETVAPDLLLIDSRTGITTTNAITTRVLADDIVVLSLKTDEQLDGTREVLRSLAPLKRPLDVHTPLGLYVLISRVSRPVEAPEHGSTEAEERTIRTVERFLTEPAVPLITTVTDPRISLLHNDAEVAEREELLMSRDDALSSRLLHLDYVEFGRQLIGRTLNELIDAALDSAASQDERAAWKRFFGRAEPVGEWGVGAQVPESLLREHERAQPIAVTVAELKRAPADTPAYRASLARALHEYGQVLLRAGKFDEARLALVEAIETYGSALTDKRVVQASSSSREAMAIGRALALLTLADVEKAVNDPAAALSALSEARNVLRPISSLSEEGRELVSQISSMQAILLAEAGELKAATREAEYSLSVLMPRWSRGLRLEKWYERDRDPHHRGLQGIAAILGLLAHILLRSGDAPGAIGAAQDSASVWRQYVEVDSSGRNKLGFAKSLSNLGNHLRVGGLLGEAESVLKEAVDISRPLAADDPANLPTLATALESLAAVYGELGRSNLALSTAEDALHYRRDVIEIDNNVRSRLALASALNNVGAQYGALEMHEEAAHHANEAVAQLSHIPESPERADLYAAALNNLALSSFRAGDIDTALQAGQAAVAAQEHLTNGPPEWQRSQTARALLNLSLIFRGADQHAQAAEAAERAADVARPLSTTHPDLYANCLGVLSSRLVAIGRYESAVDSARLAVSEYRKLAANNDHYMTTLAGTLDLLATALKEMGNDAASAAASAEARKIFKATIREYPPER